MSNLERLVANVIYNIYVNWAEMDGSQNGREVIQMLAEHLLLIVDGVLDLF